MSERHVLDVGDGEVILVADEGGLFIAHENFPRHVWIAQRGGDDIPWIVYTRSKAQVIILPPPETWRAVTEEEMFHTYGSLRTARFWQYDAFAGDNFRKIVELYRPDLVDQWAKNEAEVAALDDALDS
jgi:hypothetical protein